MKISALVPALVALALSAPSSAAVVHREADNGEFSANGLTPTPVTLAAGLNEIFGRMGGGAGGFDRDYFVVTVPASMQLTALRLLPETRIVGGSSFIGIQAGNQVTVNPNTGSANGLLGWSHYGEDEIGTDILPLIGTGFGATGFSGPLAAGDYAFWLQETGIGTATYGLGLELTPVPLPCALLSFAAALGALGYRRKI